MGKVTQINVQGKGPEARRVHVRDIAADFDAPLGTIGQELRGARMSRGEDLASVSRVLKIRKEHLEALEDDRLNALPGRTYAVGFVRAYADYLGLNAADAVERFKAEIAGRDETSKTAGFPEHQEEPRMGRGWTVIALIVLGLLAYGVYYVFFSGEPQVRQPVTPVPTQMVSRQTHAANHVSRPKAAPAASAQPSATPPEAATPAAPVTAPVVAPGPGGQVYGKQNTNAHVVLRAKQATHVLVQTEDGRAFINRVLQPGDVYQVPNMHGLSLTAERGDAVEILLNGKSMGTPGTTADPTEAMSIDAPDLAAKHGGTQDQ
jgi:cytoskeleton protein RodZ